MNNFFSFSTDSVANLYFCSMKHSHPSILYLSILILLFSSNYMLSQSPPDSTNFGSPLDISLYVAGNFGEVRSNHFHTGIDFKTQGVEGKKIYAIEDGYISRISYSHYGYGKALYINHPNGYTSVYAHLSNFNTTIDKAVRNHQYSIQKETFNLYVDSTALLVKKGEIIGLSGNSGGSYAPHLHFEIRETKSEHPMNPLLFGYQITDSKKPLINNLKIYPLDKFSLVDGQQKAQIIPVKKNKNGKYFIGKTIRAYGNIGCALHSTDRLNARNICGLYSLNLSVNDTHLFGHKMDKLDFSTSRYVNHHVDYPRHKLYNNSFHKSFLNGNNKLEIYTQINKGYTHIENDSSYKFSYLAKDFAGNTSKLSYHIKGDSTGYAKAIANKTTCDNYFSYNTANLMEQNGFTALLTPNTIYEDLCVTYSVNTSNNYLSDIHSFGTKLAGIQKTYKLIITPTKPIDSTLHDKLLIVSINNKGSITDCGGEYQLGTVTTRVKQFGKFAITMDTTKPVLVLLSDTSKLNPKSTLVFKIGDNLSGIESYSANLNGKWILTEYKRKKARWYVSLSEMEELTSGKQILEVQVIDEKGNVNLQRFDLEIN